MSQDSDEEGGGGGDPAVTSQPTGAGNSSAPIFAMPAPEPCENTSLKTSDQVTYTPGSLCSFQYPN